jgi:starch phosphorylase
MDRYRSNAELSAAIDAIATGVFSEGDQDLFQPIVESLLHQDEYMLLADYQSYIECQDRAAEAYLDSASWTRSSILNTARCGFFSSDRAIAQYCTGIWRVDPVHV